MSRYHFAEGILELPPGWSDQTVTMLVRGPTDAAPGATLSVVINREAQSGTFEEHVDKSLDVIRRTLPSFKILGRGDMVVGELPAKTAEFAWQKDGVAVSQKVVWIQYPTVVLTVTLSAGKGHWSEGRAELDGILESLRFRKPEGAS